VYAARMAARKDGVTFFKMDIMPSMIRNRPGGLNTRGVATAKGLEMYGEHIQRCATPSAGISLWRPTTSALSM